MNFIEKNHLADTGNSQRKTLIDPCSHYWKIEKFSRYKNSKWESVSDCLKLSLEEVRLCATLNVSCKDVLIESLDLSNSNVKLINLSLFSKDKVLYGKSTGFKFQMKFYSILDLDSFQCIVKKWVIVKQYYQISNSLSDVRSDAVISLNTLPQENECSAEPESKSGKPSKLPLNFDISKVSDAKIVDYYEDRKHNYEHLEYINELLKEPRWKNILISIISYTLSCHKEEETQTAIAALKPKLSLKSTCKVTKPSPKKKSSLALAVRKEGWTSRGGLNQRKELTAERTFSTDREVKDQFKSSIDSLSLSVGQIYCYCKKPDDHSLFPLYSA